MKLKDLIYFNRSDRIVLITFLVIAVGSLVVLLFSDGSREDAPDTATQTATSTGNGRAPFHDRRQQDRYAVPVTTTSPFPFDPNTADSTALLRLGLQPWQVRALYRYRAAGGIFRRKEDFARLYGLTVGQYRRLAPYIRIGSDYQPADRLPEVQRHALSADGYDYHRSQPHSVPTKAITDVPRPAAVRHKLLPGEQISINVADTAALQRVPGIGSYFARRIAQYRERLGGYASIAQLREIDDFPESALPYFQLSGHVKKMAVNRLTLQQLKRHPYINYYQAKAICDYRRLHGPLRSLDDLKLLPDFTAYDRSRLTPYLDFSE